MRAVRLVPILLSFAFASALHAQELGERQRAALAAGVDAALAVADLPARWSVERVELDIGPDGAGRYRIVHRSGEGRCFAIEGRPARGLGGPVPPNARRVPIPGLPEVGGVRIFWTTEAGPGGPFPVRTVFSDWIPIGGLAHRFVSPSDPLGGCRAVTPGTATAIVGSLTAVKRPAPPGENAGENAAEATGENAGASPGGAGYRRLAWNDPRIEAREGETPGATALRILEAVGLEGGGEAADGGAVDGEATDGGAVDGEAAVERTVEPQGRVDGWSVVVVTRTGGGDDSVEGVRYRVGFRTIEDGLLEFRVGRAFRCRAGRGHRTWAPETCL